MTNACDTEELFQNVVHNAKFLYSSFYAFTNTDIMDLIEKHGCPLKTERGNRVFPVSDKSSDVIHALTAALRKLGVEVELHEEVADVLAEDGHVTGVRLKRGQKVVCGCCHCYHRRPFLSIYRFHWRRLPLCEGAWTYHHRPVPGPGAVCGKGRCL